MTGRRLAQLQKLGVSELKTVTPRKAAGLRAMEIETVLDLLTHYPRRMVDRTNESEIGALREGEEAVVTATVLRSTQRRLRNRRTMAEITVRDQSGTLVCTFFNQGWRARQFEEGQTVTVFGKLSIYRGKRQMANPVVDLVGDQTGRLVPIYGQSGKAAVSSLDLSRYVAEALDRAGEFAEPLPERFRDELGLVQRTDAFRQIHAPETLVAREAARRRLAFDELLRLQILLVSRRRATAAASNGIAHETSGRLLGQYLSRLPFKLTAAQERAIEQLTADLAAPHPMNRLLQGDVGAGKTVVALGALLVGVEGGYQGAFMVPTEVLAEQHFLSSRRLLDGLTLADPRRLGGERPLMVDLLTSRTTGSDRTRILAELVNGDLDIVIGTHALISEGVDFARLGVVVVDEQHRFGVEQRAALREKAALDPDLLVMTATPIPRTAAMTVYGDLDHTTLDELPAGRSPIETRWLSSERQEAAAWKRVREQVAAGHQAYVVCPLVGLGAGTAEDDEVPEDPDADLEADNDLDVEADDDLDLDLDIDSEAEAEADDDAGSGLPQRTLLSAADLEAERRPPRSAVEERKRLASGPLEGLRVGLLHGQMPAKEKEPVMTQFRAGEIDVLVSTTVVEVGVDVANATVMVIEDADRFGIAQLHQLRGRVGRASLPSWCYLLTGDEITEPAERRLKAMVKTQDGFELAEEDLDLRGGGTVLGARQKGRTDLKLANLRRDRELVAEARRVANEIVSEDPEMKGPYAILGEEVAAFVSEEEADFLFRS
ncbi:MAG: ATP-dependent DNA helicase RecG [Acidimicrobiales bacterium]